MNRYLSIAGGLLAIIAVFVPIMIVPLFGSLSVWSSGKLVGSNAESFSLIFVGLVVAIVGFVDRRWLNILNIFLFLFLLFKTGQFLVAGDDAHGKTGIGVAVFFLSSILTIVGAIWGLVKKRISAIPPAESI